MNEKLTKILKGAGIAGVGAGLAYLGAYLGEIDLGAWGPALAAVLAVLANALRQAIPASDDPPSTDPNDYGV